LRERRVPGNWRTLGNDQQTMLSGSTVVQPAKIRNVADAMIGDILTSVGQEH
jgi:hypothetical protein